MIERQKERRKERTFGERNRQTEHNLLPMARSADANKTSEARLPLHQTGQMKSQLSDQIRHRQDFVMYEQTEPAPDLDTSRTPRLLISDLLLGVLRTLFSNRNI